MQHIKELYHQVICEICQLGCFQQSVVKPKLKKFLWPITTDVNSTISQSELKRNTCNLCQVQENVCDQTQLVLVWLPIG